MSLGYVPFVFYNVIREYMSAKGLLVGVQLHYISRSVFSVRCGAPHLRNLLKKIGSMSSHIETVAPLRGPIQPASTTGDLLRPAIASSPRPPPYIPHNTQSN
ncbi:unnamed protein product, partial [Laminaria digitata]